MRSARSCPAGTTTSPAHYEEAQHLLDRATASVPADVDPMRTMPLRINLALGTGDVATALAGAREVIAAGDVEALDRAS